MQAAPMQPAPPQPSARIRLPLQIGTSSLWSLARCSATLLPGLGIVGAGLLVLAGGGGKAGVGLAIFGVLLTVFAGMHGWLFVKNRPSDVVLSSDGIEIVGGPHAGKRYGWAQIDDMGCYLLDTEVSRITMLGLLRSLATRDGEMGMSDVKVLRLALGEACDVVIAEAERPIEMDSLRALYDSLRSDAWRGKARPQKPRGPMQPGVHVLACPQCGAAIAPDDKPIAACRYCRFQVQVPPDVQERVRAARQVSSSKQVTEKLIVGLLKQPGADRTNALFFTVGVPMMLVWPLAFAIGAVRGLLRDVEVIDFIFLGVFPFATILALFFVLRAKLADRQALRLLTLNFGAHEPARPGEPYTCRSCDGPLPDANGQVVVKCAYCSADNVLGLDLRRDAQPSTEQAQGLEQALASRKKERMLWGFATAFAGVLLLVGVGSLAIGLGASSMMEPEQPTSATTGKAPAKAPPVARPPSKKK